MHVDRRILAVAATTAMLALAGCGGDDEDSGDQSTSGGATTQEGAQQEASGGAAPSPDAVLACLKEEGLDAKDQSSSFGETIGIDYPGGRLVISFQPSAEEAEAYASAAETSGETAVVKGSVVITVPVDAEAQSAQSAVEGCVDSA